MGGAALFLLGFLAWFALTVVVGGVLMTYASSVWRWLNECFTARWVKEPHVPES